MRKLIFTLLLTSFSFLSYAGSGTEVTVASTDVNTSELTPEMLNMGIEEFLALTPKKYKEKTGKKLGFKNTVKLKAAQKVFRKKMKKGDADLSKGVYILLAIIGWGFLGIGLMSDWDGNEWIIALVLTALCWLPGVIYTLAKMKNYY